MLFYVLCLDEWKLQQSDVCFNARDNHFGTFTMKQNGKLVGIKLVHKSGYVSCHNDIARGKSNWGCGSDYLSIAVTDDNNERIFPDKSGWFKVPGYTSQSNKLVLNKPAKTLLVKVGEKMKLWYGEDLQDSTEADNHGRSCVDVYAVVEGMFSFVK